MLRIVLAPCSPFSVTPDLMRETAALARTYGVRLHTHLAETLEEEQFCRQRFGRRPLEYVESLGWMGEDVWHAHCVHLEPGECSRFSATGTGIAHCPTSNMRLASGIAPVRQLLQSGVRVGLGVDGSASNDGGHLLAEARMAMLLQRVAPARWADSPRAAGGFAGAASACTARQALRLATRGGAAVLGRDDIGQLAPGRCADLIAIDLNRIGFSGAGEDPLAAVVFCQPANVDWNLVQGEVIVERGRLCRLDTRALIRRHQRLSKAMINGDRPA